MLKVSLLLKVKETGQYIARQEFFRFRTPDLKIKVPLEFCFRQIDISI